MTKKRKRAKKRQAKKKKQTKAWIADERVYDTEPKRKKSGTSGTGPRLL